MNTPSHGEQKKRKHVGEYELGRTLGEGAFGKVKLGTNVFTGDQVAVKIIAGDHTRSKKDILQLERERNILIRMKHPNIVNLIKVVDDEPHNKCYLILEYVNGGELFDYIITLGRLSEKDARRFMRQIISAVEYCHSLLIVHRDLKPENLLLDDQLNIKISDFGLSNVMTPGKKFSTFCGSLHYACPEILKGKEYLGPGVDIWAMGIILYCLVVGRQPWDGSDATELITCILEDGLEIPDGISDACVNLILSMLRVNETDRIPLAKMRYHPWINEGYDEPPKCFLATPSPVTYIDEEIFGSLRMMHLVKDEEETRKAIFDAVDENQSVCIYHLLLVEKQKKIADEKRAEKAKQKLNSVVQSRDRRSMSEVAAPNPSRVPARAKKSTVPKVQMDKLSSTSSEKNYHSPKESPKESPKGSPKGSPKESSKTSPRSVDRLAEPPLSPTAQTSPKNKSPRAPTSSLSGSSERSSRPRTNSASHSSRPDIGSKSPKARNKHKNQASSDDASPQLSPHEVSDSPPLSRASSGNSPLPLPSQSSGGPPRSEPLSIQTGFSSQIVTNFDDRARSNSATSPSDNGSKFLHDRSVSVSPPTTPISPKTEIQNPFSSDNPISPTRRLSTTPSKQKKKTIIVSKFDNFRPFQQSSSPSSPAKHRKDSASSSFAYSDGFSVDDQDFSSHHQANSVPNYYPNELLRQSAPMFLDSRDNVARSPDKTTKRSTRPDRPIMSLDVLASPRKKEDLAKGSPNEVKSRVSRTGSGSYFGITKPSIVSNDIFSEPKHIEETKKAGVSSPNMMSRDRDRERERDRELNDDLATPVAFQTKLVSHFLASELSAEIGKVLNQHSIKYTCKKGVLFKCKVSEGLNDVQFTIEVIKKSDNQRGIKFKRSGGSGFLYQSVHQKIVTDLKVTVKDL